MPVTGIWWPLVVVISQISIPIKIKSPTTAVGEIILQAAEYPGRADTTT